MASKQNKQLAEKVQEIKRMQANWMRQRETQSDGSKVKGQRAAPASHQSRHSKKNTGTAKKEDKMTWVVSSDGNTKKKNLRARSASPAGRQKSTTKTEAGRQMRPASGKSNSGSRPGSGRDRGGDRGLSSKPPVAKGSISDRSVSNKSISSNRNSNLTNGKLASRTTSEPNLVVKETHEVLPKDNPYDRTTHCDILNKNLNNDSERTNQSADGVSNTSDYSSQSETSKPVENGQSETGTSGRNLLEPDAFDRLADQIASRVKAEMRQERQNIRQSTGVPLKSVLDDDENESMLSSHHCIKCKQKMVPPDYIPTVLIPCGHTFCEPCADDRIKCPTCRTKVTSTAENSTLLQIIMGSTPNKRTHSTNKQSNSTNQHSHPPSNEPYHPGNYTSNNNHKGLPSDEQNISKWSGIDDQRTPKQNYPAKVEKSVSRKRIEDPRVRAEKYVSEFESLSIRCEAMRDEEQTVMEDVEEANREIMQQKKTIGNISKQQERLREEIQQLQDKISVLDEHRAEYERKCEDLEEDKTEKITQLHMVRQMLRQLEGDKDKVRMLAQDVGAFLK